MDRVWRMSSSGFLAQNHQVRQLAGGQRPEFLLLFQCPGIVPGRGL